VHAWLRCTCSSDFVGAIIVAPRACGQNYVIGAPFGAVDIETSAKKKHCFRYLQGGIGR